MTARQRLWGISALLYALFVFWYTDFGGPLSEEEIAGYVAQFESNGTDPQTIAFFTEFLRRDSGRQFLMVNVIDMKENPPLVEGAQPGEDGNQLMARYMEHMFPALLSRASHPVIMGDAVYPAVDIVGIEGAEEWDQGALFRYRSRRDMADIVTNPAFNGKHHFKTAALQKTIAYPIETKLYPADPRFLLALLLLALTALIDSFVLNRRALEKTV